MKRISLTLFCLVAVSLACSIRAGGKIAMPVSVTATMQVRPTITATNIVAAVTSTSLHVRAEPMGLRIGYLYNGDRVTLTGKCQSGWAEIVWKGATAWVRAKYLSNNNCQTSEEE